MKIIFITFGTLFLGLGILGIVLPLLPTTPFLLLAAACYARGSERFYDWLLNHRWFGKYIHNYRSGSGIPLRAKVISLVVLWSTIALSSFLTLTQLWVPILLVIVALGISVYLLSLPTLQPRTAENLYEHQSKQGGGRG
jgi:uncharacterized membrane protein YbaN (DUF454 family)